MIFGDGDESGKNNGTYFGISFRNIAIEMYPSKRTEKTKLNPEIKIFVEYTLSMQKCNIRST